MMVCVADDRHRLRMTFDAVADLYQQARPEYPEQLYDALVEAAGIKTGDRLLEVGCATGKATIPLARCGFRITCIEIGPDLVVAARCNLTDFPGVEITEGARDLAPLGPRSVRSCLRRDGLALDRHGDVLRAGLGVVAPPEATSPSGAPPT